MYELVEVPGSYRGIPAAATINGRICLLIVYLTLSNG